MKSSEIRARAGWSRAAAGPVSGLVAAKQHPPVRAGTLQRSLPIERLAGGAWPVASAGYGTAAVVPQRAGPGRVRSAAAKIATEFEYDIGAALEESGDQ
jgi:hypothetical protein